MARIPLAVSTANERSKAVSAQRLVNMYPEATPANSNNPVALYPTPGLKTPITVGDGPIHLMEDVNGVWFVLSGNEVYTVTTTGSSTLIGGIFVSGRVDWAKNGNNELCILTGGRGYIATTSGVTQITDPDFPIDANNVTSFDNYFVFTRPNGEFFLSGINDGLSYDALDFATAERLPDGCTGIVPDHGQIMIFGKQSIEVWWNSGDATFPFSRLDNAFIEKGTLYGGTIAKADNTIFWLGQDGIFYRLDGISPVRISTHDIEAKVNGWSGLDGARAFVYGQSGHVFYVLSTTDGTVVYDAATQAWHERKSYNRAFWRANCYLFLGGRHYVGDRQNGNVYELDEDTYSDNGDAIEREIIFPTVSNEKKRFVVSKLVLETEPGVGLTSGQGSDPQVMMQYSNDFGNTWSAELWRGIGKKGEYENRAVWNRLGQARQKTFRFKFSDPVKFVVADAYVEAR